MRQVPQNLNSSSILVIGSGRLARHMSHYFELEKILFSSWARKSQSLAELESKISKAERVLIAISDSQIAGFLNEHSLALKGKTCIHFSGALKLDAAFSFHPLMTFSESLYPLETYRKIHFVVEKGAPAFQDIFSPLQNSFSYLEDNKRALYHALCSMSSNFSVLLWEYAFERFEKDLGLSAEILKPLLHRTAENLEGELTKSPRASVLTGPLVRQDLNTIEKHLVALQGDPMKQVYESFVTAYQKRKLHEKRS